MRFCYLLLTSNEDYVICTIIKWAGQFPNIPLFQSQSKHPENINRLIMLYTRFFYKISFSKILLNLEQSDSFKKQKKPYSFLMAYKHGFISSKFPKSWTFQTPILKLAVCRLNIHNFKLKWSIVLRQTENISEKLTMISLIQPHRKSASKSWIQE